METLFSVILSIEFSRLAGGGDNTENVQDEITLYIKAIVTFCLILFFIIVGDMYL
jgi:hypothetical protein